MSAYSGLASGQYSNADVMGAMQSVGYSTQPAANTDYLPAARPPANEPIRPEFMAASSTYSGKASEAYMSYDQSKLQSTQEPEPQPGSEQFAGLYDGAVDIQYKEKRVVEQRLLEVGHQVIQGVRPIYTYEKIVEVPQVIIKEVEKEVVKPEIIERILEVPKTEIKERTTVGPPQVFYDEQIVEVPQVVYEERVVHVTRKEIQERLIEVPRVEYVYRDEYEDCIEYREVPVDKIIEVPEIEYKVKEVEQLVPQTYVQEYFVDRYREVPITQVQEVERIEEVPVMVPRSQYGAIQASMQQARQAQQQPQYYSQPAAPMSMPAYAAQSMPAYTSQSMSMPAYSSQVVSGPMPPQGMSSMAYSAYDPYQAQGTGQAAAMFDAMDVNRDGVVTREEYQQYQAQEQMMRSQTVMAQEQMLRSMSAAPVGTTFAVPRGTFTPPGSSRALSAAPGSEQFARASQMVPQSMAMSAPMQSMQVPAQYGANPFASAAPGSMASMPGY